MTPIHTDGATDADIVPTDDAESLFLAHLHPQGEEDDASKKKPSEEAGAEPSDDEQEEQPEAEAEDGADEGDDEGEGEEETAKKYVDDEESYVKIKVDDQEIEVPVKDLKRLHGQEAALTRKSQEVASLRQQNEAEGAKLAASLAALLARANERWKPYAGIDWLVAAKNPEINPEELAALRAQAQAAHEDVRFLEGELNNFMGALHDKQKAERVTSAKEAVRALTDAKSPSYIEGWSEKTYDDIRSFAVEAGLDKEVVNNLVDAPSIKLIHMAMQFKRGAAKVQTVKQNKTPKKIIKNTSSPQPRGTQQAVAKRALDKLRRTGSDEDAANAFLSRLSSQDD